MTMPNFLVIGAAKSGTTALYEHLKPHPEIYMSPVKEPAFFAMEDEKLNVCRPNGKKIFADIEVYQNLFQRVSNEKAIGEASTVYLYSAKAPERIKHHIPNVKLIAILRNPVDRAYAHFLQASRNRFEPLTDFSQALQKEDIRIQEGWRTIVHYKQWGFYYTQLQRYFNYFDHHQIRVYLYEDFTANPDGIIQDIYRFLEVNENFTSNLSGRYNISGIPNNQSLHKFYAFLRKHKKIRALGKLLLSQELINKMQQNNLSKPSLPYDLRQELVQIYQNDILALQNLLQRDLSSWLEA